MNRALALAPLLLSLSACAAETYTIRELGHPQFEQVVGAEARFQRVPEPQRGQLDAFPERADLEGDHRFLHTIIPMGTEEDVYLDVRAARRPPTGLPLESLTVAVYALDARQAEAFGVAGQLPAPEQPITVVTTREKEEGVLALLVRLPRSAIPEGTERLAFPILVQFEDGWIHLLFYRTGVPAAVPTIDPSELEGPPAPGDETAPGGEGGEGGADDAPR
ncbi:MAG: hypothetical protein M9894_10670 [Planctomycetes bacterium]|nr:hypothetical protein [Planctomycetota bacterium]